MGEAYVWRFIQTRVVQICGDRGRMLCAAPETAFRCSDRSNNLHREMTPLSSCVSDGTPIVYKRVPTNLATCIGGKKIEDDCDTAENAVANTTAWEREWLDSPACQSFLSCACSSRLCFSAKWNLKASLAG